MDIFGKTYTVYFEFCGKKMKTTVSASSEADAMVKVRNKINFIKTVKSDPFQDMMDIINSTPKT